MNRKYRVIRRQALMCQEDVPRMPKDSLGEELRSKYPEQYKRRLQSKLWENYRPPKWQKKIN